MSASDLAKDAIRIVSTAGLNKDVIDLLNQKITLLDDKISTLTQEILTLKSQNFDLIRELEELKKQQGDLSPFPDGFDDTTNRIVAAMFGASDVTKEAISRKIGIEFGIAEYHFDLLFREKFINQTRIGIKSYNGHSPAGYSLTPEGRAYAVKLKKG
jgi:hypothetical protein